MSNWEIIFKEAERLAAQLTQQKVDLAEAEKLLAYFVYKEFGSCVASLRSGK